MIRVISTRLLYGFSLKNKTQNFFDMNPVYPDFAEKNFDIYNSERKKIKVVDEYIKSEEKTHRLQRMVKDKIYREKYYKFERYSGGRKIKIDKDTDLALGVNSDFDDYVRLFKRFLFLDKTAKVEFK